MSNEQELLEEIEKSSKIALGLYILYIKVRGGYWRVKGAFSIWGFLMTHSLERLNERCHGLNCFDEFYATINGGWK